MLCWQKKKNSNETKGGFWVLWNTHFEERQQQLDAFTVQPGGDKRTSNSLVSVLMGMWGGSWEEGSGWLSAKCSTGFPACAAHTHSHTHYDQEVSLVHGMHKCYKLSHTSCTTVLSRRTMALSYYSQCLSTSEALFTLTTVQSERGS